MASSPVFAVTPRLSAVTHLNHVAGSPPVSTVLLTSGTTYTVPTNVTHVTAWLVGGGGGGFGGSYGTTGAVAKQTLLVLPSQTLTYSIGTGGSANVATNSNHGQRTTLTYNGAMVRADGGVGGYFGSPTVASFFAERGARGVYADSTLSVSPAIIDFEGLSAALSLVSGNPSYTSYGRGGQKASGQIQATDGAAGAIVLQFSSLAMPLLTGAASGTRVEELRLWVRNNAANNEGVSNTSPPGTLEVWLQNTATGAASLVHNWYFSGTSFLPSVPPVTSAQTDNVARYADLRVQFDHLLLPNADWRLVVRDSRAYADNLNLNPWSVVAQGADL